jgi:hypothetical protein
MIKYLVYSSHPYYPNVVEWEYKEEWVEDVFGI